MRETHTARITQTQEEPTERGACPRGNLLASECSEPLTEGHTDPVLCSQGLRKLKEGNADRRGPGTHSHPTPPRSPLPAQGHVSRLGGQSPSGPGRTWGHSGGAGGQDPASVRPGGPPQPGPPRPARHTRRCRGRPGSSQLPAPARAGLRGRGRWDGAPLLAGPADAEPAVLPPTAGGWGAPGGDVTAADAVRRPPPGPSPTRRRADRCAPSPTDVQGPRPAPGQPRRGSPPNLPPRPPTRLPGLACAPAGHPHFPPPQPHSAGHARRGLLGLLSRDAASAPR